MTAPIVTPRAEKIAEDLLRDARAFAAEKGSQLHSRQIEALARAVARHLAALEDLMLCGWSQREEVLRAGTAAQAEPAPLPAPLRDVALGLAESSPPPAPPRILIVQRRDRDEPESVPEGEIRWYAVAMPTLKWSLLDSEREHFSGTFPYIRVSPNSPWGVRVEILGEGR